MADDSPGKVQALRAIFAEKNTPLMGMMPPAGKAINKPWKTSFDSSEETISFKERIISEQRISSSQLITKVLPIPTKRPESNPGVEPHKTVNGFSEKTLVKNPPRPNVGPKPPHLFQQLRNKSPVNGHPEPSGTLLNGAKEESRTLISDDNGLSKSRAVAETIASFMFTNGYSHNKTETPVPNSVPPPVPKPRTSPQTRTNNKDQTTDLTSEKIIKTDSEKLSNLLNSDNYICKGSCNFKRKELPSLDVLGPPPSKPSKPPHMVLPAKYRMLSSESTCPPLSIPPSLPPPTTSPPNIPHRTAPQKPAYRKCCHF